METLSLKIVRASVKSWRVPIETQRKIRKRNTLAATRFTSSRGIIHGDAVGQELRITLVLSTARWRTRAAKPANPRELAYASAKYGVRLSCAHRADKYDEYGDFHHLSGWLGANVPGPWGAMRRELRAEHIEHRHAVSFAGFSQVYRFAPPRERKWNGRKGNRQIALTIIE